MLSTQHSILKSTGELKLLLKNGAAKLELYYHPEEKEATTDGR
jgi:hypothetical protein